jgi:hypothetical protein
MLRGLSMSGKSRSASALGGGKSEGGLSLEGDRRLSGQQREKVSMVEKREERV